MTAPASIADGDASSLTLNGVLYRYTAGANREARFIVPLDVKIADDDAPGVLVTQTGNSTNVTEPSDLIVLGNGFVTQITTARKFLVIRANSNPAAGATFSVQVSGAGLPTFTATTNASGTESLAQIGARLAGQLDAQPDIIATFVAYTFPPQSATPGAQVIAFSIERKNSTVLTVTPTVPASATATFVTGVTGDFGSSIVREVQTHDAIFVAQNLDFGKWSDAANPDIENSGGASGLPHLTVLGTGDGNTDFYSPSPRRCSPPGGRHRDLRHRPRLTWATRFGAARFALRARTSAHHKPRPGSRIRQLRTWLMTT